MVTMVNYGHTSTGDWIFKFFRHCCIFFFFIWLEKYTFDYINNLAFYLWYSYIYFLTFKTFKEIFVKIAKFYLVMDDLNQFGYLGFLAPNDL